MFVSHIKQQKLLHGLGNPKRKTIQLGVCSVVGINELTRGEDGVLLTLFLALFSTLALLFNETHVSLNILEIDST
jgi:hypothetical protein